MLRAATWNIAGGLKSDDTPSAYSLTDQHASVVREVLRWERSYGCDVLALQECEGREALAELADKFEFVGSAEAYETRGFVHLYVRGGVLLPSGDRSGKRGEIMGQLMQELGDDDSVCIVGDLNIKDEELGTLCKDLRLRDARYAGVSFGAPGNRFDHSLPKRSFGQRYDRVLCAPKVWAESHLIGNGPVSFEGSEFHLSDHCGVHAYVDVCGAYSSKAKQDVAAARVRRAQLVSWRDGSQQKES